LVVHVAVMLMIWHLFTNIIFGLKSCLCRIVEA